ncbi:MAG: lytic transglycosylase domain-containing protein [Rhodopseudomonas palustris]|uniref:Lytic transglycosylase domain-containing protein n=1 Tax=Rhodopseudomonas palustris TaxID=1076 RepID=A0A933VZX5_RHOPL|nr:lytic transglycosylase domain-containing protein [Rhodopseudomonas palustris]
MLVHLSLKPLAGRDQVTELFFLPAVAGSGVLPTFARTQRPDRGKVAQRWPETIIWRSRGTLGAMVRALLVVGSTMCGSGVICADPSPLGAHSASKVEADSIAQFVADASKRFALSEPLIRAVMRVESAGDPRARSAKGAIGLMQIMPTTWTGLQARYGLGVDPYDPHDNIMAGAAYLRELHDRFGEPGFLSAYNAGPGRYEQHLATGRALPDETKAYVAAVMRSVDGVPTGGSPPTDVTSTLANASPLFVVRKATNITPKEATPDVRSGRSPHAQVADWSALIPRSDRLFVQRVDGRGSP